MVKNYIYKCKNLPFYNNVLGPSFLTYMKRQKLILSTQRLWIY